MNEDERKILLTVCPFSWQRKIISYVREEKIRQQKQNEQRKKDSPALFEYEKKTRKMEVKKISF